MAQIRHREKGTVLLQVEAPALAGLDLSGAELDHADLRGADLTGTRLPRARLREADLRFALLAGAEFREADLTGADLRFARSGDSLFDPGTPLRMTSVVGAQLAGADLRFALVAGVDAREACLSRADLRYTVLDGASLQAVDWTDAKARHASLRSADLREGQFYAADLREADLEHARLQGTDLRFTELRQTRLANAWYDAGTRWHPTLNPEEQGAIRLLYPEGEKGSPDAVLFFDIPRERVFSPERRVMAAAEPSAAVPMDPCQRARMKHDAEPGNRPTLKHIRRCAACREALEVDPRLADRPLQV